MSRHSLSIVIVNYNVKDFLLSCLASIYRHCVNIKDYQIIVVDNNSNDGSVEAVKKEYPDTTVIANHFNAGFSGGNNQGIEKSDGKYIFLLNPDTELTDDAIRKMVSHLDNNPNSWMLAPKLLNSDGSIQVSVWKQPSVFYVFLETLFLHTLFRCGSYKKKHADKSFAAGTASGAALMFRKELPGIIGLLDTNLFWMDDTEFCYRAWKKGLGPLYFPEAAIIHHSGKSSRKNPRVAISNQVISKIKFFRKHGNKIEYILASILSLLHIITRIIIFSCLSVSGGMYRAKAKAYIYTLKKYARYQLFSDESIL